MLYLALLGVFIFASACTQPTVKRYEITLERKVGTAKKPEIDKLLGNPVSCQRENSVQKCEYRTLQAGNYPVPAVYDKQPAIGPDVSPYDYFDVLHLFYDEEGILRDWQPVVVRP